MSARDAGSVARDVRDLWRHRCLLEAWPASWRAPDGVVHQTEVMMNPVWGNDRITVCRAYKLNTDPQPSGYTLALHPAKGPVSCLHCLAL